MSNKKNVQETDTTKGAILIVDNFEMMFCISVDNDGYLHCLTKAKTTKDLWTSIAKVVAGEVEDDERSGLKFEMIADAIIAGLSIALPEQYDTADFQPIITKARQNSKE